MDTKLSTGQVRPKISGLSWVSAREVLPDEARDFTPWLADNLDLLAETLGLEDLSLLETESSVEGYLLDILASGVDVDGGKVLAVIENQYSRTDHKHLGQLVTYAARAAQDQENLMAVWLVESAHPAHQAAIEFLNRTSAAGVRYFLVQVKFAPSPDGYHVYFEALARPNEFLKEVQRVGGGHEPPPERKEFVAGIFARVRAPLQRAGFRHVWIHPKAWLFRAYLPNELAMSRAVELRVRAAAKQLYVAVYARSKSFTLNRWIIDEIRSLYEGQFEREMKAPFDIVWHATEGTKSDQVRVLWPEGGYAGGNVDTAAAWVEAVATTWIRLFRREPITQIPETPAELPEEEGELDSDLID